MVISMTKSFTAADLHEFDRITMAACDRSQMTRIKARLDYSAFLKKHGEGKCRAMTTVLKDRDNKRRRA